jgi:hypothetical protein
MYWFSSGGTINVDYNKTTRLRIGDTGIIVVGSVDASGDVIAYGSSDRNLKENITIIDKALDKVLTLDGITFNWNNVAVSTLNKDSNIREPGVIAQQVQEVLPEAVKLREDGNLGVRYEKLIPLLIEAIKELKQEVDELKKKN